MKNKATSKIILCTNNKGIIQKSTSPTNVEARILNNRTPLFKLFMESNKINKIHLKKNTSNISKNASKEDSNKKNSINNNHNILNGCNGYVNLFIVSERMLSIKYNITPKIYAIKIIHDLVRKKKKHYISCFNDKIIYENSFKEFLKRSYNFEESKERIPKYVSYYKNYLKFFCRPIFCDFFISKKSVKYMEKVAQVFYNENYAEEDKKLNKDKNSNNTKKEFVLNIFNNNVIEEIEKGDKFTIVSTETAAQDIIKVNDKYKTKSKDNDFEPPISFSIEEVAPQKKNFNSNELFLYFNSQKYVDETKIEEDPSSTIKNVQITISNSMTSLIKDLNENKKVFNSIKSEQKKINEIIDVNNMNNNLCSVNNVSPKSDNELNSPKSNKDFSKIKKVPIFKNNVNKLINENYKNKRRTSIGFSNKNREEKTENEKKTINNLNIKINHLTINHKIITSCQEESSNNNLIKNNFCNNFINFNDINSDKRDKRYKENNIEIINFNSDDGNNRNHYINFDMKKSSPIEILKNYKSFSNIKKCQKFNRVSSVSKISDILHKKKNLEGRNKSTLGKDKKDNQKSISSFLKLKGSLNILDSQYYNGKISLNPKSKNKKSHFPSTNRIVSPINDNNNYGLKKVFTVNKISVLSNPNKNINEIKNKTNTVFCKNSNYVLNRDKTRSNSNLAKMPKKEFNSAFNFSTLNVNKGGLVSFKKKDLSKISNAKFVSYLKGNKISNILKKKREYNNIINDLPINESNSKRDEYKFKIKNNEDKKVHRYFLNSPKNHLNLFRSKSPLI